VADATARAEIAAPVLAVLGDPGLMDLFGPDALAEAPIAAVLPDGFVVSGTVDRLLVTPDLVSVVDFKTGRGVPATPDAIPPYHLRQMAAYVAALAVIFPERRVEAALLYTSAPVLHMLSAPLLEAHKPGFAAAEQS
jgi:ATP-dependent helicase/nuclease subunit A